MQALDRDTLQKVSPPAERQKRVKPQGLFAAGTVGPALKQAFAMLRPDIQWKNPVMFVVEIGAFLTLLFIAQAAGGHSASLVPITYFLRLTFGYGLQCFLQILPLHWPRHAARRRLNP